MGSSRAAGRFSPPPAAIAKSWWVPPLFPRINDEKNKIYFHCINLTNDKRHHGRGLTSGPYTSGSTCLIIQPKQTRHHEKQERCASHRGKCGVCRTPSKGFRGQKEEQESPQTQKRRKVQQENAQDLSQVICPVCAFSTHIFKN